MSKKVWAAGDQVNASDLNGNFFFGGTGADGALTSSSGTTTISFASARELVKNYTSVSLTGTATLAFSNKHAIGSVFRMRATGSVTMTSSATRVIDLRLMGGDADAGVAAAGQGFYMSFGNSPSGGAGGTGGSADTMGTQGGDQTGNSTSGSIAGRPAEAVPALTIARLSVSPGSGGTHGVNNGGTGNGVGGRGGGGLIIECAGTYTFTSSAIDTSGENGVSATGGASVNQGGSGGGGGGSAGQIQVMCGVLSTDSGTYTQTGGSGGGGSAAGSGSGLSPSAGSSGGAGAAALNLRAVNSAVA